MTLSEWLVQQYPQSKRTTLRQMVDDRRVLINGRLATRFTALLAPGDKVTVVGRRDVPIKTPATTRPNVAQPADKPLPSKLSQKRSAEPAERIDPTYYEIVHEDADVLVVFKPAGLLTSTVPREPRPTLLAMIRDDQARQNLRVKVGLVHRLDRDASGLLVFSKNDEAYQSLKSQFFHHNVERVYHAVVRGVPKPPAGRIESRLVERADGHVYPTKQAGRGDKAVSDYVTVRSVRKLSLVKITLHTGRKHQIRVHMSQRNWSILGDAVYGHGEKSPPETRLMLIATRLGFTQPRTGDKLSFEIPIPDDMLARVPE